MRLGSYLFKKLKYKIRKSLGIVKKYPDDFQREPRQASFELRDIDPAHLVFPAPAGIPDVSVIIPTYGNVRHTLNCLASILETWPRASLEVIVAEDASGAPDVERLRRVRGLVLIENPENLGFLRSCNAAAKRARGTYLHFLNDDTMVLPGAIDALVEQARSRPEAGLVGSKLIFPDGRLQEAGGIVWDDASAWNYGRSDNPDKPQYQYVREADYVSGASILIPRAVWEELGGFDEAFLPAYYEDTDFAFRVRASGRKVYVEPRSVVCHFEGMSHGTDTGSGIKAYQLVNQQTMLARWREVLQREHYPPGQHVLRARDRANLRPVVLFIDEAVPEPDRDAGSRNMVEFIRSLQAVGCVVKYWPCRLGYHPVYTHALQQMGVEVLYRPFERFLESWLKKNGADLDHVLISRPGVATGVLGAVRRLTHAPILYYGHDLHFARMRLEAEVKGDAAIARAADAMEKVERDIWKRADAVLYPSPEEAATVRAMEPTANALSATIFCFDAFTPRASAPRTAKVLFVAGFAHAPNVDAAVWFVGEVLPLLRRRRPDVETYLVGSKPSPEVYRLEGPHVHVTGWVSAEALAGHYADARAAVVPLRFGAGVKLKVVEALVEGVPLVTTPIGAQGLEGLEAVAAIETDPAALAERIAEIIEASDAEWLARSRRQTDYAAGHFSRQTQIDELTAAFAAARHAFDRRTG